MIPNPVQRRTKRSKGIEPIFAIPDWLAGLIVIALCGACFWLGT